METNDQSASRETAPIVDIGIVTIRDDEFRAVLAAFDEPAGYYRGRREYTLRMARGANADRYQVAILRQVEQGNGEAQEAARDLLDDLNPSLLLVVGIAGGLPSEDYTLGDVVLSTRINDYSVEARKMGTDPTYSMSGGPVAKEIAAGVANLAGREDDLGDWQADLPPRPPVTWSGRGRLYGPKEWKQRVREVLEAHFGANAEPRSPLYVAGPIASSDRLVKDPEILFPWISTARHLLAIEMESGGVYRAARDRCPMLAIRGISDLVGLKRQDAWTRFACKAAAAFARAYLRTSPVSPRTLPDTAGPMPGKEPGSLGGRKARHSKGQTILSPFAALEATPNAIKDWEKVPGVPRFIAEMLSARVKVAELASLLEEHCPSVDEAQTPPNDEGERVLNLVNQWFTKYRLADLLYVLDEAHLAKDFPRSAIIAFTWATSIYADNIPRIAVSRHILSMLDGVGGELVEVRRCVQGSASRADAHGVDRAFIAEIAMALTRDLEGSLDGDRRDAIGCALTYPTPKPPLHVMLDECDGRLLLAGVFVPDGEGPPWVGPTVGSTPREEEEEEELAESIDECLVANDIAIKDLAKHTLVIHVGFEYVTRRFHRWGEGHGVRLDDEFDGVILWPYENKRLRDRNRGALPTAKLGPSELAADGTLPEGTSIVVLRADQWQAAKKHSRRIGIVLREGSADPQLLAGSIFIEGTPLYPADVLARMIALRRTQPETHDMHIIWTDHRIKPPSAPPFRNPQ